MYLWPGEGKAAKARFCNATSAAHIRKRAARCLGIRACTQAARRMEEGRAGGPRRRQASVQKRRGMPITNRSHVGILALFDGQAQGTSSLWSAMILAKIADHKLEAS